MGFSRSHDFQALPSTGSCPVQHFHNAPLFPSHEAADEVRRLSVITAGDFPHWIGWLAPCAVEPAAVLPSSSHPRGGKGSFCLQSLLGPLQRSVGGGLRTRSGSNLSMTQGTPVPSQLAPHICSQRHLAIGFQVRAEHTPGLSWEMAALQTNRIVFKHL